MKRPWTLLFAALLLAASVPKASADPLEIPLPELVGAYPFDHLFAIERTVPLVLPSAPSMIRGAWMRVRGTVTVGSQDCPSGPMVIGLETQGVMLDDASHFWLADGFLPFESGPFTWLRPYETFPLIGPANWDFLLDGRGDLMLRVVPTENPIETCGNEHWPNAQFDEVTFIIDADFPVPAGPATWGRLKAFYRK